LGPHTHGTKVLFRRFGLLGCGAVLSACSYVMGPPDPRPPDPAPEALPAVHKIIANSPDMIFDATANAKNIMISSGIRRFNTARISEYGACVRAAMSNRAGKDMGMVTYVVTVADNRISDRRRALPADECDQEKYEPL
jgi:hypothetical protein